MARDQSTALNLEKRSKQLGEQEDQDDDQYEGSDADVHAASTSSVPPSRARQTSASTALLPVAVTMTKRAPYHRRVPASLEVGGGAH